MKKIVLTEKGLKRLCDIFSGSGQSIENPDEFVQTALDMEEEIPPLENESSADDYDEAHEEYANSSQASDKEKAALRKMTEFAITQEQIEDILSDITNEEVEKDEMILAIRKMAEIIIAEEKAGQIEGDNPDIITNAE